MNATTTTIHGALTPIDGDLLVHCGCVARSGRAKHWHAFPARAGLAVHPDGDRSVPPVQAKWAITCDTHLKRAGGKVDGVKMIGAGTWGTGA